MARRKNIEINQEEVQDNFLVDTEENSIDTGIIEEVLENNSDDIDTGMLENPFEVPDPDAPFVYLKRNSSMTYMTFMHRLREEDFILGTTYEDYLDNMYVLLTKEQVQFHEENPGASVKEVLDMQIKTPEVKERTLWDAKREMEANISQYDNSENVNSFTINEETSAWFTVQERTNYKNSIDSAKLLGVEQLSFFIGNTSLTISTELAERMLAAIQLYADTCFIVTKQHKLAVNSLETVEEVDNYDYTVGYPDKLNFTL